MAVAVGSLPLIMAAWWCGRVARATEAAERHLADIRHTLREHAPDRLHPLRRFDLADAARDPAMLVSATLVTARFPRLARFHAVPDGNEMPGANVQPGIGVEIGRPAAGLDEARFEAALAAGQLRTARTIARTLRAQWGPRRFAVVERRLDALAQATAKRLRARFGDLVRTRQFEDALRLGEQIAELFPGSVMERDFRSLRPVLQTRAQELPPQTAPIRIAQ